MSVWLLQNSRHGLHLRPRRGLPTKNGLKKVNKITVWKFNDFSITQILREINFGASRSAKSAIFIPLEALNLDFYENLHFFKAEIDKN